MGQAETNANAGNKENPFISHFSFLRFSLSVSLLFIALFSRTGKKRREEKRRRNTQTRMSKWSQSPAVGACSNVVAFRCWASFRIVSFRCCFVVG